MSGRPHREPPRLAEWLLGRVLPRDVVGRSILGDVREEHAEYVGRGGWAPDVWYWLHAARVAAGYLVTEGRSVEMGTILKDIRFGARALTRMPGSAALAVVVLAIGIGLCSFMFSVIYGIYFRGMDIPDADRVVAVYETNVERDQLQRQVPVADFADWRERQTSFEGLLAVTSGTMNLAGGDEPARFSGAFVTADAFALIGVEPVIGRGFAVGADRPGEPPDVVLGYTAWRERFGGDRSVVGTTVRVNGESGTVLGVMPEGFEFPDNTEVWAPLRLDPLASARGAGPSLGVWGRLRDGVTREQASLEMARIAGQLEREHPEANAGIGAHVMTVVEANTDETLNLVFGSMMFAVVCVLLVACANVASLLLARAAMRTKEAGVRVAMGGSRLRVMLPFFAEALVLAGVGALLGIGITYVAVDWFDGVTAPARTGRPWFMQFAVDPPILAFVVGVTLLTALVAGVAPAVQMSRTDVSSVLKDESRGSSSRQAGRLTRVLVTAEVALSCALLVGAGLMTKSMVNLGGAEYPFRTEGIFTARVGLFAADYPDRDARQTLWRDLLHGLQALPGVDGAALATVVPYGGTDRTRVRIDGVSYAEEGDLPALVRVATTPGFFELFGTTVTSGRDFTEQDDADAQLVAIVNQPMVDRYFDGADPLGRTFRLGVSDTLPRVTVVGVVPDLHMDTSVRGLADHDAAGFYLPVAQTDASFMSIAARARGREALALTSDVRDVVRRLDPDLPIYNVRSEPEVIDQAVWFYGVFGTVFVVFGAAALFMASAGLYGVLAFGVSRRTHEMGIRMALGAGSRDVVGLVARQGAGQLTIGLAIGLALAFAVTRLVSILMYDVDPQDPVVFGSVLGLIVAVGMAAAVFPARRATSVDPVEALRAE